ncbi:diguanylate cyclase [Flavimaricola marinus]|uniref:diguanylate cyclase n=1 Tax=Flavimaricola marinus TaxID=1819565 RepID=UPI001455728F|nr:diguanylate cyclase [Flavimaricola marinus]
MNQYLLSLTMGALFGMVAMISMVTPIIIGEGVIVDLRNLFIGVSFGYFGWIGGATTLGISILVRMAIGGDGALSGIVAMTMAGAGGMAWRQWLEPDLSCPLKSHLALGSLITLSLGGGFLLPEPSRSFLLIELGPTLAFCYVGGSVILAGMLRREILMMKQHAALQLDAQTDPLTNLPNRRGMQNILSGVCANKNSKDAMAMLCFDIDRFKQINDTYGHIAGDAVLREVTKRVNGCLRARDHLARHGGDEFVVLQTGLTKEQAFAVAERCRSAVASTPVAIGEMKIDVTISIGVYWVPDYHEFDALFARADEALYKAKQDGRNVVRVYMEAA